jgi:uncharacterized LabA/DUF88 family protein
MISFITFIDLPNLRTQLRDQEPDLVGLRAFLQNRAQERYEVDTVVFDWIDHETDGSVFHYHEFLQHNGFRVITKEVGDSFQSSLEMEIAIEAFNVFEKTKPNVLILVSGNGNFAPLCQNLREKGIRIEIASLPSFLAKKLRSWANESIDLTEWATQKGSKAGGPIGHGRITGSEKSKAESEKKNNTPEKGESKTKGTDWENLEKEFPGIIDFLLKCGLEAERLYFAVKEVGLSEKGDMEKKWKTAVLDRFGDGSGFRYINGEVLEDKGLYQFAGSQEKRDFIGNLLRKMILLKFSIAKKEQGQQLSARILYKKYMKIKQQNCP